MNPRWLIFCAMTERDPNDKTRLHEFIIWSMRMTSRWRDDRGLDRYAPLQHKDYDEWLRKESSAHCNKNTIVC